jgi:hypothetical protein
LASKSKIPPQLGRLRLQPGERRGDLVDSFGFHGGGIIPAALCTLRRSCRRKRRSGWAPP